MEKEFRRHNREKHDGRSTDKEVWACGACNRVMWTSDGNTKMAHAKTKEHMKSLKVGKYACATCLVMFTKNDARNYHELKSVCQSPRKTLSGGSIGLRPR